MWRDHAGRGPRGVLAAFVVVAAALTGCASSAAPNDGARSAPPSRTDTSPSHGQLTDEQFRIASKVAREQGERSARSISGATATVGTGVVTDSNTGHPCTSGTLLHIKVIGEFNITHGGLGGTPGRASQSPIDDAVHAVLITADGNSGEVCLISVQTGDVQPDPGAVLLFDH